MTPEERGDIDNAVWMCATHATLIDRDETTYTVQALKAMKVAHEAQIAQAVRGRNVMATSLEDDDLIALGPDLVCTGRVIGGKASSWKVLLTHYVIGEMSTLISYGEHFSSLPAGSKYILVNALGNGRLLAAAPTWERTAEGLMLELEVLPDVPRIRAHDLGTDLALGVDGDLEINNGDLATVSGLKALPQKIQMCLWSARGTIDWAMDFGHRISEYFAAYRDSPWFDRLVRLELIRLASVPYYDDIHRAEDTPFRCVARVLSVEILGSPSANEMLPARVEFDVVGVGHWRSDVSLYVGS
jgi:hypothetical protein